MVEYHDGNCFKGGDCHKGFDIDRVDVDCNAKVDKKEYNNAKKKYEVVVTTVREAYPNLDCYYQIVDLHKDVLWKSGVTESQGSGSNPLSNIKEETKYTIKSAKSLVGPFKNKEGILSISIEGSGLTKALDDSKYAGSFETPNSTRIMLTINDFPYRNTQDSWKGETNFMPSKLAVKTFFGSSGKTDNKVVYRSGQKITVSEGGSGKKIGYFHWAEFAKLNGNWDESGGGGYPKLCSTF